MLKFALKFIVLMTLVEWATSSFGLIGLGASIVVAHMYFKNKGYRV